VPFARPTLSELVTRIRGDFRARLSPTGSLLRRAVADVLATVWAGSVHMVHGHIVYASEQLFGVSADRENLIKIAGKFGLTITPATFAEGTVTVVAPGPTAIPDNTVLVRDDGATYTTTALTVITGSGPVPVIADLAGSDGNMEAGDTLVFETPIVGVDAETTVILIDGGFDEESTADFRARYLQRRAATPEGGTDSDYIGWALEVAGVTRAWVNRHESGLGTLTVRFVLDGEPSIFPSPAKIAEVQAKLDLERPLTAEPTAAAPVDLPAVFTIALVNDTAANRAAVEAELEDLVQRDAEPGNGAGSGTILLSSIRTAIGNAADGDYTLTVPAADIVPILGELVTFSPGAVTWV